MFCWVWKWHRVPGVKIATRHEIATIFRYNKHRRNLHLCKHPVKETEDSRSGAWSFQFQFIFLLCFFWAFVVYVFSRFDVFAVLWSTKRSTAARRYHMHSGENRFCRRAKTKRQCQEKPCTAGFAKKKTRLLPVNENIISIVGGWATPLKHIKVSWDD